MQGGDISASVASRWLVVFEGVIASIPKESDLLAHFLTTTRGWRRYVELFEPHELTCKQLWDLAWRQDRRFDVVTFLPLKCEQHVVRWLDRQGLPLGRLLHYTSPDRLTQSLATMPDVWAVIHADTDRPLRYGPRGRLVGTDWLH